MILKRKAKYMLLLSLYEMYVKGITIRYREPLIILIRLIFPVAWIPIATVKDISAKKLNITIYLISHTEYLGTIFR